MELKIALIEFLSIIEIRAFDEKAAAEYGKVKTELRRRGCIIGALDTFIAAHARSEDVLLVTNNTKEFECVENLRIENWV